MALVIAAAEINAFATLVAGAALEAPEDPTACDKVENNIKCLLRAA